jgi:hypothetical protein
MLTSCLAALMVDRRHKWDEQPRHSGWIREKNGRLIEKELAMRHMAGSFRTREPAEPYQ